MKLPERIARLLSTRAGRAALTFALEASERVLKLSVSQGRARGGGQSSKAKGREAVCRVRDLLAERLGVPHGEMMVKATSMPGVDLYISPEGQRLFPYAIEVKSVESLNIWAALAQAEAQAGGTPAVVFFKRSRSQLYVALEASEFVALQARYLQAIGVQIERYEQPEECPSLVEQEDAPCPGEPGGWSPGLRGLDDRVHSG